MYIEKNKRKYRGCLLLLCILPGMLSAQSGIYDPYSFFGIGTPVSNLNVRNMGIGGVSVGLSGAGTVSSFNPASYAFGVDTFSVVFDIGFHLDMGYQTQRINDAKHHNFSVGGGLGNLEVYVPIFKWWKMGAFLLPYTSMSYKTSKFVYAGEHIGQTQVLHIGTGGLNKVGWGNAFQVGPVALGVNLNFIFGNLDRENYLMFKTDSLTAGAASSVVRNFMRVRGLGVDFGLMYVGYIESRNKISVGAAYSLPSKLSYKAHVLAVGEYAGGAIDTAFISQVNKGQLHNPSIYRLGLSYERAYAFLVGLDFTYTEWSKYKQDEDRYSFFRNTWNVAYGIEFKMDPRSSSKWRHFVYRLGGNVGSLAPDYEGKNLIQFGFSAGLGIPVRRSRSMVNVGFDYSRSGNAPKGQIQQDIYRIGVNFSSIETWFVKRKYD